MLFSHMCC